MTVFAIAGENTTNASLIADCIELGYIHGDILDPTYGYGGMWSTEPDTLVKSDLDPERGVSVWDFTAMPFDGPSFDSIVFDPPYRLAGTATTASTGGMDDRYGINEYLSINDRHAMICAGIAELSRILRPGGHLLVKCQDQVCSGRVQWQTRIFADALEDNGLRLADALHLMSYRAQPSGRRQLHARRNYSTMLVGAA